MVQPTMAVAAQRPGGQLFMLCEAAFDDTRAAALEMQHAHLNDITAGGFWSVDARHAVLHAFLESDSRERVAFEVRFGIVRDREALKAAGAGAPPTPPASRSTSS